MTIGFQIANLLVQVVRSNIFILDFKRTEIFKIRIKSVLTIIYYEKVMSKNYFLESKNYFLEIYDCT